MRIFSVFCYLGGSLFLVSYAYFEVGLLIYFDFIIFPFCSLFWVFYFLELDTNFEGENKDEFYIDLFCIFTMKENITKKFKLQFIFIHLLQNLCQCLPFSSPNKGGTMVSGSAFDYSLNTRWGGIGRRFAINHIGYLLL